MIFDIFTFQGSNKKVHTVNPQCLFPTTLFNNLLENKMVPSDYNFHNEDVDFLGDK